MFAADYAALRLTSLQYQVRCHQDEWRQVETDSTVNGPDRSMILGYRDTIIPWLQERLESMEGPLGAA